MEASIAPQITITKQKMVLNLFENSIYTYEKQKKAVLTKNPLRKIENPVGAST